MSHPSRTVFSMKHMATTSDPTISEILEWFDEAGLSLSAVHQSACTVCATPAAA